MGRNVTLKAITVANACKDAVNLRQLFLRQKIDASGFDVLTTIYAGLLIDQDEELVFLCGLRDAALKRQPMEDVVILDKTHKRLKPHLDYMTGVTN